MAGQGTAARDDRAEITTLFWDLGGVLLTDGWDRQQRAGAVQRFGLDQEDFEERHELVANDFETGRLTLDEYLDRTIFCRPGTFSRDEFRAFMFAQSQPQPRTLAILAELARDGRYLLATLNNEPLELNAYRIEHFRLRDYFTAFFSSCYLRVRKPDRAIYEMTLGIAQRTPAECLVIDDRKLNVEAAQQFGFAAIHYRDPDQLRGELRRRGVAMAEA